MNRHNINYPEGTKFPTSWTCSTPDQITLDVFDIGCGDRDECSGLLFAVVDCRSREVESFQDSAGNHAFAEYSLWQEVNDFLASPAGLRAMQDEIQWQMDNAS